MHVKGAKASTMIRAQPGQLAGARALARTGKEWLLPSLAVLLLVAFLAVEHVRGALSLILQEQASDWQALHFRVVVVSLLLLAYVPAAERHSRRVLLRSLSSLRLTPQSPQEKGHAEGDVAYAPFLAELSSEVERRPLWIARAAGAVLFLGSGVVAIGQPGTYLDPHAWTFESMVAFGLSTVVGALVGGSAWHSLQVARLLSWIAAERVEVRLLDLEELSPFAHYGLRVALLWVLGCSIASLFVLNRGFALPVAVGVLSLLCVAAAALIMPLVGIHRRIRDAKSAELSWTRDAIRRARSAMDASASVPPADSHRREQIADLLAYEARIASVNEWLLDRGALLRFTLVLLLGVGSWVGGAVVERLIGAWLD